MGLYRGLWGGGGGGGGGALCPQSSLDPRMHEDYACVCVLNFSVCLSVYQPVCLSKSLFMYMPVCLHVSLSPPLTPSVSLSFPCLSFSICGVDLADQESRARCWAIQDFSWDFKSVPFPINLTYFFSLTGRNYPNTTISGPSSARQRNAI